MSQTSHADSELHIRALREALETAARIAKIAQENANKALLELTHERERSILALGELAETNRKLDAAMAENRRLRNLLGEVCMDQSSEPKRRVAKEIPRPDPQPPTAPAAAQVRRVQQRKVA